MEHLKRAALLGLLSLGGSWLTACKSSAPPTAAIPTVPVATVGTAFEMVMVAVPLMLPLVA